MKWIFGHEFSPPLYWRSQATFVSAFAQTDFISGYVQICPC